MRGTRYGKGRRLLTVVLGVAVVAALWLAATGSSAPTGTAVPSSVSLRGWDTVSGSWTTGNTIQYAEGQAIPFQLEVSGLTVGTTYLATVCHEFVRSGVYGFLGLEPYSSDVSPSPGGAISDTLGPFSGVGVDLVDYEAGNAQGACGSGEKQVLVSFEVTAATAYVLWGGHLAAPLDAVPGGGTVGYEQSAGWNNGASLAMRLESPDKTVPIPPGKIIRLSKIDVNKVVQGGSAQPSDFCFTISPSPAGQGQVCGSGSFLALPTGSYTVTESGPAGYALHSVTGTNCVVASLANGTATASVQANDGTPVTASCTFTNVQLPPPHLIVKKVVVNDDGGTKVAADFSFSVNGGAAQGFEADGENDLTVSAGTYTVVEPAVAGYSTTYSGCANVVLVNGQTKTCTITNDDQPGTLIVKKVVVNDDGGAKGAADFSFSVNGAAAVSFEADGQNDLSVDAGTYSVTEPSVAGYATTYSNCSNLQIPVGGSATCTITNDDQPGTLIVKKVVVNDDGGAKVAADFSFSVNGAAAVGFEADGQNDLSVSAGTYTVTEPAVAGYTASYDNCAGVVVPPGGSATCTVTNDDQPGTLIVRKVVVNDDGGAKGAADFSFSVNGAAAVSFEADGQNDLTVDAGTYSVTEPAVAGYSASYDNCSNVQIPAGGSATCTITNDDQQGTLIVKKVVVNDDGGSKTAADFSFKVGDGSPVAFEADGQNELTVDAGTYTVTEPPVAGYATTYDGCAQVVVPVGGSATCTITNDDASGTLIVRKVVVNDDGGAKGAADFSFSVNGATAVGFEADGQNDLSVSAGTYTVTEPAVAGYTASYEGCAGIVVPNGGSATCTITNDDQPGTLIVKKVVVNDEGGTKVAADFSFSVNGAAAVSFEADGQNELTVDAGTYAVTEPAVSGYATSYANCAQVVVPVGGSATCTITNDDDVAPSVSVDKSASPATLAEPGGQFTFTIVVSNTSAEPVTITALGDSVYGNLLTPNASSTCDELAGWELAAKDDPAGKDEVTCSFTVTLTDKQAGFSETDIVTATVVDDEQDSATGSDDATIGVTDVPSSIAVIKTASPTAIQAPGGQVQFSVVVQNTSAVDSVTITSLVDSIYGDLDGKGTCAVPQTIAAGGSYSCAFSANVTRTETDVVTASGTDDDRNPVSASDDATVTVTVTATPPPPPRQSPTIDVQVVKDATAQVTLGPNGTATIQYSLVVRNNGPNMANAVTVADAAPSGVVFGAITKQPDFGSCTVTPALLSCNLGSMGLGVQTQITWTATVNVTGSVTNSATGTGAGGPDTNPGNNTDTATTVVVAPLTPPTPTPAPAKPKPVAKPALCSTLLVQQKMLRATGSRQTIRATVRQGSKKVAGARITIVGPGIRVTVRTNRSGVALVTVSPQRAGIIRLSITNKKPCNTQRIGVVGVFEPPVTG